MKKLRYFLIGLFLAALTACGGTAVSTPNPTATPEAAAVAVSRPTDTAVPATEPPPATATTQPTSASTAVPRDTPTTEPATDTPKAEETATDVSAATTQPIAETQETNTPAATTPPTSQPAPPPAGGVPAPADNNYPGNDDKSGWENRIIVPAGFDVTYVGRLNQTPTSITFGPDGLLYIAAYDGNIAGYSGNVYTMDVNSGAVNLFASGYPVPTGIAFRPGTRDLYISSRVVNENVGGEAQVSIVNGRQIIGGLPCCYTYFHSANGIAFGPDGMGYVGVGARSDHGEVLDGSGQQDTLQPYEASILRFNPDTGEVSVYARGFRNAYDIAWDANGQLWATDNTPDYDPPERLHRVVPGGQHGYPWYDCDVCFKPPADVTVIPPLVTFAPSASPTGITVYLANQFPGYYNSMFVTLWSAFPGAQKVMHIGAGGSAPVNFATGFAAPIDVTVGPDGSLYVADWATSIIFKISYTG